MKEKDEEWGKVIQFPTKLKTPVNNPTPQAQEDDSPAVLLAKAISYILEAASKL